MQAGRGGRASTDFGPRRCVQAAASGPTPRKIAAGKQVDSVRPPVSQGHASSSGLSMSPKLSPRLNQERAQVCTTPRAAPGKAAVHCAADMHVRRTAHADAGAEAPRSLQSTRIPSPASEAEKVAGQLEAQTRRHRPWSRIMMAPSESLSQLESERAGPGLARSSSSARISLRGGGGRRFHLHSGRVRGASFCQIRIRVERGEDGKGPILGQAHSPGKSRLLLHCR